MANELRHKTTASTNDLYSTDWVDTTSHIFNSQAAGDILYASSTTQLSRLGVGSNGDLLYLSSGLPTWGSTIAKTITHTSGKSDGGTNFNVTIAGTGGAWQSGIFASVTQPTTKGVDGYISVGEFELNNSAPNASAMSVLTLNWNNSSSSPGAPGGSTQAYVQLRDYSSGTPCANLLEFTDLTIGTTTPDEIMTSVSDGYEANCLYAMRFTVKNVPYWFLASKVDPS